MLGHLLKLVWKRKTRNLMLTLEILLAFVLVFGIVAATVRFTQLYAMPLGYAYENVWTINLRRPEGVEQRIEATQFAQLLDAVRNLPQVDKAALATFGPFSMSDMTTRMDNSVNGVRDVVSMMEVSDDFFDTSSLQLVAGRWFGPGDERAGHAPVAINARMARRFFPGQSAVGKQLAAGGSDKDRTIYDIVGVFTDYRSAGDFGMPKNFMLRRFEPGRSQTEQIRNMIVKLKPGVGRDFEVNLMRRLKQVRNDWDFSISPQSEARDTQNRYTILPLTVLSVVAGFLLVMVGFGLFGVLWQHTARRTPEIGLRRAVGATAGDIYRQIVAEQMLLSSLAVVGALVLLVQLPITGALGESMNWTVFGAAAVLSAGVIYLLSLLCAVYPGWRASRLTPTEALHYE